MNKKLLGLVTLCVLAGVTASTYLLANSSTSINQVIGGQQDRTLTFDLSDKPTSEVAVTSYHGNEFTIDVIFSSNSTVVAKNTSDTYNLANIKSIYAYLIPHEETWNQEANLTLHYGSDSAWENMQTSGSIESIPESGYYKFDTPMSTKYFYLICGYCHIDSLVVSYYC